MISLQQIRAARGLLNWSQAKLARACGLSATAMNNIDRGIAAPRLKTLERIRGVFEENGVEFTEGNGVRMREEVFTVRTFTGQDAIPEYFDDVVETLKKTGDTALHILKDESVYYKVPDIRRAIFRYYKRFREHGLKERVMVSETTRQMYGPPDCATYRKCSEELADQIGSSVYGNKYSLFLPDKIVTIENADISGAYRRQFMHNWDRARPMPQRLSLFEQDLARTERRSS